MFEPKGSLEERIDKLEKDSEKVQDYVRRLRESMQEESAERIEDFTTQVLDTHNIADDAITSDQIAANAIVAEHVYPEIIAAEHIATGAIEEAKIAADAVTAAKIAVAGLDGTTGNVSADHIVANMLQTGCVTSAKIYADAVTATKINVVGLDGETGRIVVTDQTDADEVTGGINTHAVTLINAGKILISGSTSLDDWSHGSDATLIDGGDIYTNSVTAAQIAANTITTGELNFTPYVIGTNDLDDVTDGSTYAKMLASAVSSGVALLSEAAGDLDDIDDGTTYAKVLNTDITAGHVLLTAVTGDLDDIADGSTYGKVAVTDISSGHILLTECTGDLDDISDGSSYGKVALTSITAGKIIVAGLDSAVTARMFTDSTTKTNIEAWKHASDVTMIDGGNIYTNSITADSITAGTITADEIAVGTITADNLVPSQVVEWHSMVSANIRNSNDTESSHVSTSYTKEKETKINEITGAMRIHFELKSLNADDVWGRIYVNGIAVGTERSTVSQSYVAYTQDDLGPFAVDDLIQVYTKAASGERVYVKNLRLLYDRAVTVIAGEDLSTGLPTVDQTVYSVTNNE